MCVAAFPPAGAALSDYTCKLPMEQIRHNLGGVQLVFARCEADGSLASDSAPFFRPVHEAEPGVLLRLVPEDSSSPHAVVLFTAAEERPAAYPPRLPFVSGVESIVLESISDQEVCGAKWICTAEEDSVFEQVVAQSLAAGWMPGHGTAPSAEPVRHAVRLQRDGCTREIQVRQVADHGVVELWEGVQGEARPRLMDAW